MAQLFLVPIDLGNNEIRNVLLQQLASDPSPLEALIYYNTTSHEVRYYNGTAWVSLTAGGGSVTAVTGTAPIVSSGGSTPAISITAATGSAPGSMSAADKTKLDAATSSPSASTLALRDGSGRMQAATPSAGNDVTNKTYVDNLILGAEFKDAVRAVAVANVASLSGTTTIDGVALVAGDRVLLTAQSTGTQNGVWIVAAGAWTRPADFNTGDTIPKNRSYFVSEGTVYHDRGWTMTNDTAPVVGTDSPAFTMFTGLGEVVAGNGLTKPDANTIAVLANGTTITVGASGISVTTPMVPFSANVGDGVALSYVLNHAMGTRDVIVQVYRNSTPWDTVICDVERTDTNNVTVRFSVAPTTNQFRVLITKVA
jgi:hypothetical protein